MSTGFCSEAKSLMFSGNGRRAALGKFEGLAEQKWRKRREWRDKASFLGIWSSAGDLLLDWRRKHGKEKYSRQCPLSLIPTACQSSFSEFKIKETEGKHESWVM